MNLKTAKKVRQMYRRDLRDQSLAQYSLLKVALKPKPRYLPVWIWKRLVLIYVKKNYRDKLFGKKML